MPTLFAHTLLYAEHLLSLWRLERGDVLFRCMTRLSENLSRASVVDDTSHARSQSDDTEELCCGDSAGRGPLPDSARGPVP